MMVTLISTNKVMHFYYDKVISKCEMTHEKLENSFTEINHNIARILNVYTVYLFMFNVKITLLIKYYVIQTIVPLCNK